AGVAGALRDQLHRLARMTGEDSAQDSGTTAPAAVLPAPGEIAIAVAVVLGVLALPLALGAVLARRLLARAAPVRRRPGVGALGGGGMLASGLAPANSAGLLLAAGGIAWGAFAAAAMPVVFPPLIGLGRVDTGELWRLLGGWCGLVALRAIAVAL